MNEREQHKGGELMLPNLMSGHFSEDGCFRKKWLFEAQVNGTRILRIRRIFTDFFWLYPR
jgi:hypothetical protein